MLKTDSGNSNSKKKELSWGSSIFKRVAVVLLVLLLDANNESEYVKKHEQINEKEKYTAEVKITSEKLLDLIKKYKEDINKEIKFSDGEKNENGDIIFFTKDSNKKEFSRYIQRMIKINIFENLSKGDNCQGQKEWDLTLTLDSDTRNIDENMKYLCNSWNDSKKCLNNSPQIKIEEILYNSSQETTKTPSKNKNTDPEKRKRKAADFLRSFDCVEQESISKPKIVKDKMGIFPTQVKEKELELWFRWRLTKCMGDSEKIKKITINIDYSVAIDFNQFWYKFADYIKEKNNLNCEKVIKELIKLCEKQPVIIIIDNVKNLYLNDLNEQPSPSSETSDKIMFSFFSDLFKLFKSEKNKNAKSFLVILLAEGNNNTQDTKPEYLTQINQYSPKEDIIKLQFTKFLREDIVSWLTENERKLEEEGFDANIEPGMMKYLLNQDSRTLLHDICQKVLKLENGILDVEHYWKNTA